MANQALARKSMYNCELGNRKQRSKKLVGGNIATGESILFRVSVLKSCICDIFVLFVDC